MRSGGDGGNGLRSRCRARVWPVSCSSRGGGSRTRSSRWRRTTRPSQSQHAPVRPIDERIPRPVTKGRESAEELALIGPGRRCEPIVHERFQLSSHRGEFIRIHAEDGAAAVVIEDELANYRVEDGLDPLADSAEFPQARFFVFPVRSDRVGPVRLRVLR